MRAIVLDTSAINRNWYLVGGQLEKLMRFLEETGIPLLVPEVVIEEQVAHFREEIQKAESHGLRLDAMIGTDLRSTVFEQLEELCDRYRGLLVERIEAYGAILPIPSVEHITLVKRDLGRRKPFSQDGRGYRDALIWHTIVEEEKEEGCIAVITANTKDFMQQGELHPDLKFDPERHSGGDRLVFFQSIKDFCSDVVDTYSDLEAQNTRDALLYEQVKSGQHPFVLARWLRENVAMLLSAHQFDVAAMRFEDYAFECRFEYLIDSKPQNTLEIRYVAEQNAIAVVNCAAMADFRLSSTRAQYELLREKQFFYEMDSESEDGSVVYGKYNTVFGFDVFVYFDPLDGTVRKAGIENAADI